MWFLISPWLSYPSAPQMKPGFVSARDGDYRYFCAEQKGKILVLNDRGYLRKKNKQSPPANPPWGKEGKKKRGRKSWRKLRMCLCLCAEDNELRVMELSRVWFEMWFLGIPRLALVGLGWVHLRGLSLSANGEKGGKMVWISPTFHPKRMERAMDIYGCVSVCPSAAGGKNDLWKPNILVIVVVNHCRTGLGCSQWAPKSWTTFFSDISTEMLVLIDPFELLWILQGQYLKLTF